MSETPRTDAEAWDCELYVSGKIVFADFARQLERELNEATKDRDQWKALAEELASSVEHLQGIYGDASMLRAGTADKALTRFREMKASNEKATQADQSGLLPRTNGPQSAGKSICRGVGKRKRASVMAQLWTGDVAGFVLRAPRYEFRTNQSSPSSYGK